MKQAYISILLLLALLTYSVPVNAAVSDNTLPPSQIIQFEDGSYISVSIYEDAATRATQTKSASKVSRFYDSSNTLRWCVTLHGTFAYTGTFSTCASASCDVAAYGDGWTYTSKSAYPNANHAFANATMVRKVLGVTADTKEVALILTCSVDGSIY